MACVERGKLETAASFTHQDAVDRRGDREDRRLCVGSPAQIVFRTFEHQLEQPAAERRVGFVEGGARRRKRLGERLSHPHVL